MCAVCNSSLHSRRHHVAALEELIAEQLVLTASAEQRVKNLERRVTEEGRRRAQAEVALKEEQQRTPEVVRIYVREDPPLPVTQFLKDQIVAPIEGWKSIGRGVGAAADFIMDFEPFMFLHLTTIIWIIVLIVRMILL